MREIKFRGYEPLFKKWAYGHYHPSEGYQVIFDIERSTPSRPYPAIVMHESIGQYTGLTDKNGVDIYEGDIVEADIGGIENFEIRFVKGRFTMKAVESDENSLWILDEKCKIIGNIYENPELLEVSTG